MNDGPAETIEDKFRGKIEGCERLLGYAEGLLGDWPGEPSKVSPMD